MHHPIPSVLPPPSIECTATHRTKTHRQQQHHPMHIAHNINVREPRVSCSAQIYLHSTSFWPAPFCCWGCPESTSDINSAHQPTTQIHRCYSAITGTALPLYSPAQQIINPREHSTVNGISPVIIYTQLPARLFSSPHEQSSKQKLGASENNPKRDFQCIERSVLHLLQIFLQIQGTRRRRTNAKLSLKSTNFVQPKSLPFQPI